MTAVGRLARPAVAFVTTLLLGGSLSVVPVRAQGFADCLPPGGGDGSWVTFGAPRFSVGPPGIEDIAIARARPNRGLATNGSEIVASTNTPCTWRAGYRAPDGTAVRDIYLGATGNRGWAMLERSIAGRSGPGVAVSDDGGARWRDASGGLPPTGDPQALAVVEAAPEVAFLLVDVGGGTADLVFATTDAGRSWSLRSDVMETNPQAGITGLAADPIDPRTLWAYGRGGLYRSDDGGRSFARVDEFAGEPTGPIDIVHLPGSEAVVTVFRPARRNMARSTDGGATWFGNSVPGTATSVAHARDESSLVISAAGKIWGYHAASFSWIDLLPPRRGLHDVEGGMRNSGPIYFAHTGRRIALYTGPSGDRLPVGGDDLDFLDLPGIGFPQGIEVKDPELGPARELIELDVGDEKRVRYRLDLPRRPVSVDVFFLVDTTDSMERVINDLKITLRDIAGALARRNLDARFGLAEVRTFPDQAVPTPDERNFVYKLQVQLTNDPRELISVLERLTADAGGRYEGNLAALDLLATGRELEVSPPGPVNNVPAGQQADFRSSDNTLRVVVHATNSRTFEHPKGGPVIGLGSSNPPPSPGWNEVISSLSARDIKHVGISVGNNDGTAEELAKISRGTGSVAVTDPVDCDGDGAPDVPPGAPLVCELSANRAARGGGLALPIVNLVDAVQTRTDARLEVTRGQEVVARVSPATYSGVVEQSVNLLDFDVVYRCTEVTRGERVRVVLEGVIGNVGKAAAHATVVCSGRAESDPPLVAASSVTVPLAVLALPPAPPPPPAYTSQAQAQAQSQAQAQAQGALAKQEEQRSQLAYAVQAGNEPGEEEQLAMSAYRPRSSGSGAPVFLYAAATAMTLAFGVATRTSVRVQEARATRRT
jgi:photosystem II stability/assembly factor-like uncharacterized protein